MAKLVVSGPLLAVREDLIGLLGLFEAGFGLFIIRITIRVVLHCQPPIGLLQFSF